MALVTPADVRQIIETSLSDDEINVFITSADALVTQIYADETGVTEEIKKEVERWLAAHFLASSRELQLQESKAGSVGVKFQGETKRGLDSTFYGQNAKVLDPTGKLAMLDSGKKGESLEAFLHVVEGL